MSELKFSSSDEALQYLADVTQKKVRVAKKYEYVFDVPPTGTVLRDIIKKSYNTKVVGIKKGNDYFQIGGIELISGAAYLVAVKSISALKELGPEEDVEEKEKEEKYLHVFDAPPVGTELRDIIEKHFKKYVFGVKKEGDRFKINAIELKDGKPYLIAVREIKPLSELEPEEEKVTVKNKKETMNKNVRTQVKLV